MSTNGRFVLIRSQMPNLVPGQIDHSGSVDLFLKDRWTGRIKLVSHAGDNLTGLSQSNVERGSMNGDGSMVVFTTRAGEWAPGRDAQGKVQAYLYRASTGAVTLLTRDATFPSLRGNGDTIQATLNTQGTEVVIVSKSTNLVPGFVDGGPGPDVFVIDLSTLAVTLISHAPGAPLTGSRRQQTSVIHGGARFDDAGQSVAFVSTADNLVTGFAPPTSGSFYNVFVHDLASSTTTLVSHEYGQPNRSAESSSWFYGMSADGQLLLFSTASPSIVAGQSNPVPGSQLFLYDRSTSQIRLVSHSVGNTTRAANGVLHSGGVSADGTRIVFGHAGTDLMSGIIDTNGDHDFFSYNVGSGAVDRLLSHREGQPLVTGSEASDSMLRGLSADGLIVGFSYRGTEWTAGFSHGGPDAPFNSYTYDMVTGTRTLLSRSATSPTTGASDDDILFGFSRDGSTIIRRTKARNLALSPPGSDDWFTITTERATGISAFMVTRTGTPSASANGQSQKIWDPNSRRGHMLSDDGQRLLFLSKAPNLIPGTIRRTPGFALYLRDRSDNTTRLISHTGDGVTTTGDVYSADISGDGSTVLFAARSASDIVPGFVGTEDRSVFAYDVATGSCTLISGREGSATLASDGETGVEGLSRNGRFALVLSSSSDLFAGIGDLNDEADLILVDLELGNRTLISESITMPGYTAEQGVGNATISPDGRHVAFESRSRDLTLGFVDRNFPGGTDVFAFDVTTGTTRLVSRRSGTTNEGGDRHSYKPSVINGGAMMFTSAASDLVQGFVDRNGFRWDGYHDDGNGAVTLLTGDSSGSNKGWNGGTGRLRMSGDGSTVWISSTTTDAVPGFVDSNGPDFGDLYARDMRQGTTKLVTHQSMGTNVGLDVRLNHWASLSYDGKRMLWSTDSRSILPSQSGISREPLLYLTDLETGARSLVTEPLPASPDQYWGIHEDSFALSRDGSSAYFGGRGAFFVEDDLNFASDVFFVFLGRECAGVQVCGTTPNSIGQGAELCITGSEIAAANLLNVSVSELPTQSFGLMLASMETGLLLNPGGSLGNLCIAGTSLGRYSNDLQFSGSAGRISMDIDLTRIPSGAQLLAASAGSVFAWQYWYRDVAAGGASSNLSDARIMTFR